MDTVLSVPRIAVGGLPPSLFLDQFVAHNTPVIVTGALDSWDLQQWTPETLGRRFGDKPVQVYNNYFDLQTVMLLREYLSRYLGKPVTATQLNAPYVRWYTRLRDLEFCWADEVFAALSEQWRLPEFLPDSDYLLPYAPLEKRANPVTDHFPAKGLFVSPRGARTSLHVDPWGSCAILCQLYGHKSWYFYAPDQAQYLRNDGGVVDVTRPDRKKFPAFDSARLTATCTLSPGEVIYVPHGWFHQVECDSDAVSLTWNFVHSTTAASLYSWLKQPLSEFDRSVLAFFFDLPETCDVLKEVRIRIDESLTRRRNMLILP